MVSPEQSGGTFFVSLKSIDINYFIIIVYLPLHVVLGVFFYKNYLFLLTVILKRHGYHFSDRSLWSNRNRFN